MQVQGDLFKSSFWQEVAQGRIYYDPNFLSNLEADRYFSNLRSTLPWQQERITMFGRSVLQPRLQAWHGDVAYTYSGLTMSPHPWTPDLNELKARCEAIAKVQFNSVLANLYRHGQDSMGWHQDNEPELGRNPVIASVNLGETRRFLLRNLHCKTQLEYELSHGALLIMAGELQHHWKHAVPKTAKPKGERINLTFRHIVTNY
ncbi:MULTISPECIES: alpha-ketoglutarate-dependent dioxygenase AlkB family protein [Vibrio]|uniref:Alpha-ketoglutarate-dependent dioxygenase AlkB family protein n=1 Tax=Vibrio jasicida TaxID=766224 RepID=A0ABW7JFR2_9VIBR|nr:MULTISPECIES: alpha-ketoglutarate-dependent dioxygenase AlkB [Vibrio]MCF6450884.1 alpha-ketoglutarate-dependent dioxygenase AlkB [Vibrio sp. MMG023]UQA53231.1 alpha-ketoglutarate-dependent dioxygenase AlkB [Vibrio sp. ED002]CAH1524037.1 Alkylated DNA repair protein [Vibrio jasicida]CAH1607248.1 Alkylated DNA repair protein [Vibrio jasicida]